MRKLYPKLLFSLLVMLCSFAALAQVSVTATAGTAGPTAYTTLRAAFAAINAGTHQGVVTVSITGNTTETATAVLNASAAPASYTAVNVTTTGTFTISMNADTSLVHLAGADNVTIDGSNTLTLTNTHVEGEVIEFSADATTNTIKNTIIKGATNALDADDFPVSGVVLFSEGTTTGNDDNIIENCDIDGTGSAACNIFSFGLFNAIAEENSGNIIRNNKIHDNISNTTFASIGMLLLAGNTSWTIENNSFYHTNAVNSNTFLMVRGILILPDFVGDAHIVRGNFVGGNAASAAGTMSLTASGANAAIGFIGIDVETGGTGNVVENNTVKNVTATYGTAAGSFTNSGIFGFIGGFNGTTTFNNNTVSDISISNTAGFISFQAIHMQARTPGAAGTAAATFNITNNTVNNITSNSGGAGHVQLWGMRIETSSAASQINTFIANPTFNVTGNTVTNLSAPMNSNQTFVRGIGTINSQGGTPTPSTAILVPKVDISNNTIHTLSSMSSLANYGAGVVTGIHFAGSAGAANTIDVEMITKNTIHNLSAGNTGDVGAVAIGILATNGKFQISENKIYDLRNAANATTAANNPGLVGITVRSASAASEVFNNFVSLGDGQTGNLSILGIINNFDATGPVNIHYNTVVVSGTGVAGNTRNTAAFIRGSEAFGGTIVTPVVVRNNIFYNTRTGGGKHYGLANTAGNPATPATGFTSSHNNIYSSTAATVALWGATDNTIAAYNTSSADANSKSVTVTFANVATGDLHLSGASMTDANLHGTSIATVGTDIDNDVRDGTAPFMGADEPVTVCVAPAITVQPTAQTACAGSALNLSVTATGTGLTYQWRLGGNNIAGATSATYTVASAAAANAGSYDVVVTNTCGTETSVAVTVTINDAPSITAQPTAQSNCSGSDVTFNVTATTATGTLSYQWKKDGANIAGATTSSYTVAASTANAGNYSVEVSNGTCAVTSNAVALTVTPATSITTHPAAVTACQGNATFTVVAAGANLTYQWRKNGTNIAGATNASYTIAVAEANEGDYSVVVTGTCGSATSNAATLNHTFCTSVPDVDSDLASVIMMPNLVRDATVLRVQALRTAKVKWNVVDGQGKVVMSFTKQVMAGKNDINLYLGQLSGGTYQLQGVTEKGVTTVVRFVKM